MTIATAAAMARLAACTWPTTVANRMSPSLARSSTSTYVRGQRRAPGGWLAGWLARVRWLVCLLTGLLTGLLVFALLHVTVTNEQAGYASWADANDIVVLYPQAKTTTANPEGCWDWFG